jgi:EmrB/QacA subfamily drug resistance transporter
MDQPPTGAETRWILPATILGSSLSFIDSSVVNVALPAIQRDLQASLATVQWIVNGYMLMLASLILPGGSASDRFGRRRIFLIGLGGFVTASLACALAPGAGSLVAARLVQGIAAALLVPSSLAIIGSAFSGEARGRAIGTWASAAALTTAFGPPLGGWLIDTIGWRAIFVINLPIGVLAMLFAYRMPADRPAVPDARLDLGGALLAVMGLGLICYGLISLGRREHSAGMSALAAAALALVGFMVVERRSAAPMMPLSLFGNRSFSGANALTVLLYAALSGALFLLPFVFISVRHYSASAAGSAFLPFAIIMAAGSRAAGALGGRFGARPPLIIGALMTGAGYALLAVFADDANYWSGTMPGLIVLGVGMTIAIAPLTTAIFDSSPRELSGIASGINNTAARAGGLIAVAALGLAFGETDAATIPGTMLISAYRLVLFVAAAFAAASALIAALTIRRH